MLVKIDIADNIDMFNKVFNTNLTEINLYQKQELEYIILGITENINYLCDQWWGAETEYQVWNDDYTQYKIRTYRGEGDSLEYALLALLISMKRILSKEIVEQIRYVLEVHRNES